MNFPINIINDIAIIELNGSITIGKGDIAIRESVLDCLLSGIRKIVLNFENVDLIDSSGIGELVCSLTTSRNRGSTLKICSLPDHIAEVLTTTAIISIFEVFDSSQEALDSF